MESFTLHHASLRNVVERVFSVVELVMCVILLYILFVGVACFRKMNFGAMICLKRMKLRAWRDDIAQQMWTYYQRYQAGVKL